MENFMLTRESLQDCAGGGFENICAAADYN